jgi:uncharacterized protein YeaO (DUF488 family)
MVPTIVQGNRESSLPAISFGRRRPRTIPVIHIKRVFDPAGPDDGKRYLVDRFWPRGLKKDAVPMDGWLKDVAPSDRLRRWFAHDPTKWEAFRRRYHAELDRKPDAWQPLVDAAASGPITLLFAARDRVHNHAVALQEYLQRRVTCTA